MKLIFFLKKWYYFDGEKMCESNRIRELQTTCETRNQKEDFGTV